MSKKMTRFRTTLSENFEYNIRIIRIDGFDSDEVERRAKTQVDVRSRTPFTE